ncbi:MAG: nucleoside hydrolase [Deinococcus sp.]|nr:nucleoside hydrolase [Deinococcus sp.]MCL5965076.1 nucleoside hydrolase [Deinococcus sp.]
MPQKIIFDTDPGHDDAIAIMLALASPELEMLGITTTFGNVALEKTTRNALVVRELLGKTVPVYAGAERPLLRERISAENVHGHSGLETTSPHGLSEGPDLQEPQGRAEAQHAALFIIQKVLEHPGKVTLVSVGPLTNLALAMRLEPKIVPAIKQIVLMGGSLYLGNTTPAAEFNILCDPHAAKIVFDSGAPLTMFGLNLTHQTLATPERIARFRALGTRVGEVAAALLDFFRQHYQRRYGYEGAALHDPATIAYLVQPDLFKLRPMFVEVDSTPGPGFGRTVCDYWQVTEKPANCQVALEADAEGFFELLVERIGRYR